MSIKLTVSTVLDALEGLPQDAPVVFAEVSEPGHPDVIAPIDTVEAIDANLNYSWDGDNLDESGCIGEPAVVIWWKDSKHSSSAPARPVQHRLITWDWREQPDLEAISSATTELSRAGTVYSYPVKETGGDFYACVISTAPLDEAGVQSVFEELWLRRDEDDEPVDLGELKKTAERVAPGVTDQLHHLLGCSWGRSIVVKGHPEDRCESQAAQVVVLHADGGSFDVKLCAPHAEIVINDSKPFVPEASNG